MSGLHSTKFFCKTFDVFSWMEDNRILLGVATGVLKDCRPKGFKEVRFESFFINYVDRFSDHSNFFTPNFGGVTEGNFFLFFFLTVSRMASWQVILRHFPSI